MIINVNQLKRWDSKTHDIHYNAEYAVMNAMQPVINPRGTKPPYIFEGNCPEYDGVYSNGITAEVKITSPQISFFETTYKGRPSGLLNTKADVYIMLCPNFCNKNAPFAQKFKKAYVNGKINIFTPEYARSYIDLNKNGTQVNYKQYSNSNTTGYEFDIMQSMHSRVWAGSCGISLLDDTDQMRVDKYDLSQVWHYPKFNFKQVLSTKEAQKPFKR